MGVLITPDNWREYRFREANRLFSIGTDVQYSHGFTRFDDNYFGRVARITPAGMIYVTPFELDEIERNIGKSGGGWIEYDYDPKTARLEDVLLQFLPHLRYNPTFDDQKKKWKKTYEIIWSGPKNSGNVMLRKLEVQPNGRIRATLDSDL